MRTAAKLLLLTVIAAATACVPSLPGGTLDKGATGTAGAPLAAPMVFVQGAGWVPNVAVDSRNIYWADSRTNAVMMAPHQGGPAAILSTACSGQSMVAVTAESLYCSGPPGNEAVTNIFEVPLDGRPPKAIASVTFAVQIAVNREGVYWTTFDQVMKVGLDGGRPMQVAAGQLDANAIIVDAMNVYWVTIADSALKKIAISGGTPIEIARSARGPAGIGNPAVDATSVYWTDVGTIMRTGIEGGPPAPAFAAATQATSLVADASGVYWTDTAGVVWAGTPAGDIRPLASAGSQLAYGITADAENVYWLASDVGSIFRAPKY